MPRNCRKKSSKSKQYGMNYRNKTDAQIEPTMHPQPNGIGMQQVTMQFPYGVSDF